eukprot:g3076.t1
MDHNNRKQKKRRHQKADSFTSFKPELNNHTKKRKKKKQTSSRSSFLDQVLKGASAEYPKSQSSVMSDEDDLEEEEREEVEEIVNTETLNFGDHTAPTQPIDFFEAGLSQLESFSVVHETRPPMFDFIGKKSSSNGGGSQMSNGSADHAENPEWSLLTSVRFLSSHTFDWLDEFNEKSKIELDSLIPSRFNEFDEDEDDDNLSTFRDALMYWRYPMETLPSTVVRSAAQSEMYVTKMSSTFTKKQTDSISSSLSSSGRDRINFLSQRYSIWIESFRNLYRRLRHQRLRAFFYMTPKFVAQFRWYTPGTTKRNDVDELVVLLSPSTPKMRKALRDEGIEFKIPYESSETSSRHARPSRSMLVFSGINTCHKMYNFLLNLNARESVVRVGDREKKSRADVPTLFASRPFLNASSCRLRVDVGGKVRLADGGISRTSEMHSLRLTGGPILPSIAMKLRRVIHKLQDSIYEDKIHGIDLRMSRHAFTHAMGPEAASATANTNT